MYTDFYNGDPDYFNQAVPTNRQDNSYYYDGQNVYQQPYVSGQDPCYSTNMRQQNPPTSRRFIGSQQQYQQYPDYGTYDAYGYGNSTTPNYFNQPAHNVSQEPQFFNGSNPNMTSRRYVSTTPYTNDSYKAYEPQQNGLNTNLFNKQNGYSNPINQNVSQQYPQRQLLKVSCPQQMNGFRTNKFTAPRMPEDPGIDWRRLNDVNKNGVMSTVNNNDYYGTQNGLFDKPQITDRSWIEIARSNFK